jgi:hypothetical protein
METYYRRSRTTLEAEVRRRAGGQLIGGWQTNDHSFLPREGGGAGMEKGKFNPKKSCCVLSTPQNFEFPFFALTATISIFVSLLSSIVTILWSHHKSLDAFALLVSPRPSAIHFTPKFSIHLKPYRGSPHSRCSSSAHRWSTSTGAWVLACGRGAHSSRAHGQGAEAAG